MDSFIEGKITPTMMKPVIYMDSKLDFSQITPKFFRILKQFQPFGPGNANPIFLTEDVYDGGGGRKVGAGGVHMRLDLMQESQPYHQIAAIAFNMSEFYDYIKAGNPVDICYSVVENFYRGSSTLQLRLKDMKERNEFI
jgi:single-stranded-DNA-specific exonuclease